LMVYSWSGLSLYCSPRFSESISLTVYGEGVNIPNTIYFRQCPVVPGKAKLNSLIWK
jgi:hypothetical protein